MKHHTVVKVLLISGTSKKKGIGSSNFFLSKMLIRNYPEGKMNICSMQVVDYFIHFSSTPRNRRKSFISCLALIRLLHLFVSLSCDAKRNETLYKGIGSDYPLGTRNLYSHLERNCSPAIIRDQIHTDFHQHLSLSNVATLQFEPFISIYQIGRCWQHVSFSLSRPNRLVVPV